MTTANEGRDEVAKLIGAGISGQQFGAVGIGTSGSAASDSDTSLLNTLDTHTGLTASRNGNTVSLVGTFTGNSASVRESTMYSNTNTILLARQVVSTINVQNSDTLEITWDLQVSN